MTQALRPAARDAFAIFEDLSLLGNGEHRQFLQLEYLHKTFVLEPIESVFMNYYQFQGVSLPPYQSEICMPAVAVKSLSCSQHSELLILLYCNTTSSPSSSNNSPLNLETEAKVILTLLIKLISGETDAGESRPGWMRML